jgi:AAA+ superfamily predicted ATPase
MIERLDWRLLDPELARAALATLTNAPADGLTGLVVVGETAKLPFYRRWRVLRLIAASSTTSGPIAVYALVADDRAPMLLEGDAGPVHLVNTDEKLKLTAPRVPDYIHWFLSVLRVDGHAFVLFEEKPAVVSNEAERQAAAHARPLTARGRGDDGAYLYDAVVTYQGALFACTFSVLANGEIEMTEDEPLLLDFPAGLTPKVPELGISDELRAVLAGGLRARRRSGAHRDQPPGTLPGRRVSAEPSSSESGVIIDLSDPARARARLVRSTPAAGRTAGGGRATGTRPARSGRPTIVELVELLLDRALQAQSEHRLLGLFNASLPTARPLKRFAALVARSSPVVIVETTIPFVEEPISEIVNAHLAPSKRLDVHRGDIGLDSNGQEVVTGLSLPSKGPGLVLLPLQVYGKVGQVEKVAFELVARDLAAIITCTRFGDLPESLRRHTDVVLRLPPVDVAIFEELFTRIFGQPPKRGWRRGGSRWVKYLLHTDLEHPRRMRMNRDDALAFIRAQVTERITAIDPREGLGLKDLHGLGEARQFAEDLIADIHSAIAGRLDWSQVDRGALLVGAPGTGKTTLARAIAKDCGVRFIQGSASTWMAQGVSLGPHITAIRKTFTEARDYAPSILFIDEIDSIGSREQIRGDHNSLYQTEVINAVLEQMQGLDPTAPVFVIGATNYEEGVDPALRRAGRLDRTIRIPRPNGQALDLIYQHYLKALTNGQGIGPDVDTAALGQLSVGLTGADVERFVRGASRRARKAGRALAQTDVIAEITNKPRSDAESPRLSPADLERTAVHEAGHALAAFLSGTRGADIGFVTIVPRDDGTLGFMARVPDERIHLTRRDYEDKLDVFLAGRAAEELRYGIDEVSSGAASDLQAATELVTRMVTRLGLGGNGRLLWSQSMTGTDMDVAAAILSESYTRVLANLARNVARLDALAVELSGRQELRGDEVRKLLRRRPRGPAKPPKSKGPPLEREAV